MASPLITTENLAVDLGDRHLFQDVSLSVNGRDRIALVGRNASGKSTLVQILAGRRQPDAGRLAVGASTRIGYLAQEPDFSRFSTAAEVVRMNLGLAADQDTYRIAATLDAAGLAADADPATLSGGGRRMLALACVFASDVNLLFLDEPTNHLDIAAIERLEKQLGDFSGALVLVSHDRRFLEGLSTKTWWLTRGTLQVGQVGFGGFEKWAGEIEAAREAAARRRDIQIAQDTRWLRTGITARRRRNQGRLKRLAALREARAQELSALPKLATAAPKGPLSGRRVIEAREIAKAFDEAPVVRGFSTLINRGDRIGIIGPNGVGKTTLLRMLIGELAPDSGHIRLGSGIESAYIGQDRAALSPEATVREILNGGGTDQVFVQGAARHVASYLKDFLFQPEQVDSPVTSLSGGERNRLLLAKAFAMPSNLLILDEPTNDLDMETLDLLTEILADYDGTLLLVSHDRDFLDRTVSSTIAFEGRGSVTEYAGGFSDYLRQRPAPEENPVRRQKPRQPAPKRERRPSKLGYKDQRALDALPSEIESLNKRKSAVERDLADPDLFARDPGGFAELTERLAELDTAIGEKEQAWLELEMKREALEQEKAS